MKTIHRIICALLIAVWSACADEHFPEAESGRIVLEFSSGLSVSRATESTDVESALSHFDVFIWNLDGEHNGPGSIKHYERIHGPLGSPTGSVSLQAQKNDFENGKFYRMDVIANAKASEETFRTFDNWTDLRDAVQEDYRIQVTGGHELGAVGSTISDVPSYFLMDGVAKQGNTTSLQLNTAGSDDIHLSVILNRAAAKIEVRLKAGTDTGITFLDTPEAKEAMGYYLRNLCYSTNLLSDGNATHDRQLRKTDLFADATNIYFHWTETEVAVVAYAYSHHWTASDFFDTGTRMIVNLPVKHNDKTYNDNFYQILLTQGEDIDGEKRYGFNRNTHYIVEATIHAPGAVDHSEPVVLTDLVYSVKDWKVVNIGIGNDAKPTYLSVNKETLDMHNISEDATSLSFISSSAVEVTVQEAYYYDKFGQKKSINVDGNGISATPDTGLTGNITVKSNVPTNNAIRYISLKVDNTDGSDSEYVLVRQYPLEYITNIQGWYSYRSDFGGTTYENYGANGYVGASWNDDNNRWDYSRNEGTSDGALLGSKVAVQESDGRSTLYYYYWGKEESNWVWPGGWQTSWRAYSEPNRLAGNLSTLKNARMYHVRITSTSSEYKVGIPKQKITKKTIDGLTHDEHITETSQENKELVSPSFMIASQLGATQSPANVDIAAKHCANYVEVYKDENGNPVHLTNWRLPTEAEVNIIIKFQYVEDAAMDEVLSGQYYWSATGAVTNANGKYNNGAIAVRCVRDAY